VSHRVNLSSSLPPSLPLSLPAYISLAQHGVAAGTGQVADRVEACHEHTFLIGRHFLPFFLPSLPPSLPPSVPAYISPAQHGVAAGTTQVADRVEARHEHALFGGARVDVDAGGGREGGKEGRRG